jgi:Fur family transcriptional regulator, ferric uptake regulator
VTTTESTDLTARLHALGLRVTPQRRLVLQAVDRLGHATPEAITVEVERIAGGVDASTVYRTLELFEELGLVRHTHLGPGPATYHSAAERAHLHLVCETCGRVFEARLELAEGLAGSLEQAHGFIPDVSHMAISGTCADCAARTDGPDGTP